MKQALSIFLSLSIFIFSCGFTLAVTYCPMSEEFSVSLDDEKSCCCKDEAETDCCEGTQINLGKITDNYLPEGASKLPAKNITPTFTVTEQTAIFSTALCDNISSTPAKAPPGKPVSRNVLFRVLII